MIVYFETSALLPLLVRESSTPSAWRLWHAAGLRATSRLCYVEAAAVLAAARRTNRLTDEQWHAVVDRLDRIWQHLAVVDVGEKLVRAAVELAGRCGLRGYAAVHCASAQVLAGDDLVVVSGDQQLLTTCRQLGMATANLR